MAWSDSSDSAFAKFPMVSPGVAMPSQMCCRSIPRCAAFSVGAEPRKIARASRLVTFRVPSAGRDASILAGVDDAPSMSASITGLKLSSRYCEISVSTSSASSGTPPGMISGAGSSRSSQLVNDRGHQPQHATGALEPVQRRPVVVQPVEQLRVDRVRRLIRSSYDGSATPDGNSARFFA